MSMNKMFDLNRHRAHILHILDAKRALLPWKNPPGPVEITLLGVGESNVMLRLAAKGQPSLTLRLAYRADVAEQSLTREFALLQQLPADLGPQPFLLDLTCQELPYPFAILSYIPGLPPTVWSDDLLRLHATNLARMHEHEFTTYSDLAGQKMSPPFSLYERFLSNVGNWRASDPWIFEEELIQRLSSRLDDYFREQNHFFTSLPRFSLIHGDLCIPNILVHEEKLRYIDWEYGRYGDGALDFAQLAWEFDNPPWQIKLTEPQLATLFQAYLSQRADPTLIERYKVWCTYIQFFDHLTHRRTAHSPRVLQPFPSSHYQTIYQRMFDALARQFL